MRAVIPYAYCNRLCIFRVIGRYEIRSQVVSTVAPRAIFSTNEDTNKCRQCSKISLRRCALQRIPSLSINDIHFDYLWISLLPVARFYVKRTPSIVRRVIYVFISSRDVSARLITNRECFNKWVLQAESINSQKSSRGGRGRSPRMSDQSRRAAFGERSVARGGC